MGRGTLKIVLFFSSLLFFASGFAVGISAFEEYLLQKPVSRASFELADVFFTIIFRNLVVGLLISILGFVTAGISSAIILFWNGLIVGRLFNVPSSDLWEVFRHFIFHGGFELTAFFLFGAIGLRGFFVFKDLIAKGSFSQSRALTFVEFTSPAILLLVAAIIESFLIVYV